MSVRLSRSELIAAISTAGPSTELNLAGAKFQRSANQLFAQRLTKSTLVPETRQLHDLAQEAELTVPCIPTLLAASQRSGQPIRVPPKLARHITQGLRATTACRLGNFPLVEDVLDLVRQELPDYSHDDTPIRLASNVLDSHDPRLPEALALIAADSGYAHEINTYLRLVVPIVGNRLRHSSHASGFGAIFVNVSQGATVVEYVDALIHELAHHALTALTSFDPMINNGSTFGRSPLRTDERPLISILHAAYVLVRVAHALGTMSTLLDVSPDFSAAAIERADKSRRLARKSLGELARCEVEWTTLGRHLREMLSAGVETQPPVSEIGVRTPERGTDVSI